MALDNIEQIIEDMRQGKMVILMDDEDRENEGDIIMAAEAVTAEHINFMARYARGLICLTLTRERCLQLKLPLMVQNNGAQYQTNFTLSIEAAEGVTTGISAADRATTVQAAVAKHAKPDDIVQPGHIFPLMAQPGGVLSRAGHTEAGCDLARLAGFEAAAVIVEILNEDGTMARRPDLEKFAQQHDLKIGTIADLIEYRNLNEKTVERVAQCAWPTPYGDFQLVSYLDTIEQRTHLALVKGQPSEDEAACVRVHLEDPLSDLLCGSRCQNPQSWPLQEAIQYIAQQSSGVIVLLSRSEMTQDGAKRVLEFQLQDQGEHPVPKPPQGASRTIGVGSQILADLGVQRMKLLSSPKRYHALSGFKLEVVEYIDYQPKS